ncbi:MAG TPA: RES family NAD+ phosphorylase [Gemmatales bacterium]|mgnify:CR=1 FL=1|nr:RES family NAD+ phosphorylase [Gemmatales bacterium]
MIVQAFRIVRQELAATAFSGEGARRYGGRWNPPGYPMVYTADSIALTTLELLVHLPPLVLHRYCYLKLECAAKLIERVERRQLLSQWYRYATPRFTRLYGAQWLREKRSVVLAVPSAVVQDQINYLLNPEHPDFDQILISKPKPYRLDRRLFDES